MVILTLKNNNQIVFNLRSPELELNLIKKFKLKLVPKQACLTLGDKKILVSDILTMNFKSGVQVKESDEFDILNILPLEYKDSALAFMFIKEIQKKLGFLPQGRILNRFLIDIHKNPMDTTFFEISVNNCCTSLTNY